MCKNCLQRAIYKFNIPEEEAYAYVQGKSKETVYCDDVHEANYDALIAAPVGK